MTLILILLALALLGSWCFFRLRAAIRFMTVMPGRSHIGALRPLDPDESLLAARLEKHVRKLAEEIGVRHEKLPGTQERTLDYIAAEFRALGYDVVDHACEVAGGQTMKNLEVEIRGLTHPEKIVIVGAHYDTILASPGADDNASGIASVIELARLLKASNPGCTLRFVAFDREERPNGQHGTMGSQAHARRCRERGENVIAMLAMESLAYYSDKPGSQLYPPPFNFLYPSVGNFIGFIGDTTSRDLVHKCIASFRSHTAFPSEGVASWRWVPGVGSSDHEPFWCEGYQAVMVTCTAPFRNPNYHTWGDTPESLDYPRFAQVVAGVSRVIRDLTTV